MGQDNRPERETVHTQVKLSYDVESEPTVQECELPFVIGLMADFGGALRDSVPMQDRSFVEVDAANFNAVLERCAPVLRLRWAEWTHHHTREAFCSVALRFQSLVDFGRDSIERQAPGAADAILSREPYRKLASSWHGLRRLVDGAGTSPLVQIRMLDVGKSELWHDFREASSVSETALFRMVHDDISSVRGRTPFSILIADHGFTWEDDVELMSKLSEVAAAIHAPLLVEARPEMFGCGLEELNGGQAPEAIFEANPLECSDEWRVFRESDSARFAYLVMLRISLRCQNEEPLWGSAAYAIAGKLMDAFRTDGWFAAISGGECGALQGATAEITMGERRAQEWSEAGFCALASAGAGMNPYLASLPSHWRSGKFDDDKVGGFVRYSAELPYHLTVCRFVQYLRAMVRDGGMLSRSETEAMLNRWLFRYVASDEQEQGEWKNGSAIRPLRSASVEVITKPGNAPDRWTAVCYLHPVYLLRDFSCGYRVVVDLPTPVSRN